MARRLHFCDSPGNFWREDVYPDSSQVLTAMGPKVVTSVSESTRAQCMLAGAGGDSDGDVSYTARHGGSVGNSIRVGQAAGAQGAGNENLPLRVSRSTNDLQVLFATDGIGNIVIPTAQQVVDGITADVDASNYIIAVSGGDGSANVGTFGLTTFTGGIDNGDYVKFLGSPPSVIRINTIDVE